MKKIAFIIVAIATILFSITLFSCTSSKKLGGACPMHKGYSGY